MPTIAIYTRVSDARDKKQEIPNKATNKRQTVASGNAQYSTLLEYCHKMGWTQGAGYKIKCYMELASASSGKHRPKLNELMQACFRREVDIVLVWKIDRFARSMPDFVRLITELTRLKVRFIATSQGIDTDQNNPAAQLMMNMLAAFAQFERDLLSERVKEGMRRAKEKGREVGRPKRVFDVEKVIKARARGTPWERIAEYYGVGVRTIQRRVRDYEDTTSDI